ncbi:MAG TPA: PAS domain S-box protein [Opitutaceae bacterium]|nr:PAS domain S-box protein [Opitutaceae bacterium]
MAFSLRDAPIRRKLVVVIFLTSVMAMLLMGGTLFVYEYMSFRQATLAQFSSLAKIIAANNTAALAFQNQEDAQEMLGTLKAEPLVTAASLYREDGNLFATYPATLPLDAIPAKAETRRLRFSGTRLTGFEPVIQRDKHLGTLYLHVETAPVVARWVRVSIVVAGAIIAAILLVTYLFSRALQKRLSDPILALANTARAVSEHGDYTVRATKHSRDEVGTLTDAFNHMLIQIHGQDRALRESEGRVRAVINSALSAVIVMDAKGMIADWNARAESMFGWSRAEALGRKLGDTIVPARYRERHERGMDHYLATGDGPVLNRSMEMSALRRNGTEFPVEISISPLKTDNVITFCGFITDITERKRIEEVRARLVSIVESSEDAIIGNTLDGTITSWNRGAEKIFGYAPAEAIGQPLSILTPPESRENDPEILRRISRGENIDHFDAVRVTKDGGRLDVSVSLSPIKDENSRVVGASSIARDITAHKHAQEEIQRLNQELEQRVTQRTAQLEAVNRELEAFSYSVSHDLRAPLRHVDGFAGLLAKHANTTLDEKGRRYLTTISGAARQMGRLIDDLLSFSRMGRAQIKTVPVDQNAMVATVIRETRTDENVSRIEWVVSSLPTVQADPAMLRQVWFNLIDNAVKYSGKNARPRIEIGSQDAQASEVEVQGEQIFFVRDNGVGFDMTYVEKLFGVFQRLHGPAEFEGTGIGLANVRRIINRHGGRAWAEGRIGEGATFYFSLPTSPLPPSSL